MLCPLHRLSPLLLGLLLSLFLACSGEGDDDDASGSPGPDPSETPDVSPSPAATDTPGPQETPTPEPVDPTPTAVPGTDGDGDGVPAPEDCNDSDASINPSALERCDGRDNDCDGQIDEGTEEAYYPDQDGDGYGTSSGAVRACPRPAGYAARSGDCDDTSAATHPGAQEVCDDRDNDCDNVADDGLPFNTWYLDRDGDGYGLETTTLSACAAPDGYAAEPGDCDDNAAATHPDAGEICTDGKDNDCDGAKDEASSWYRDADGDGYGTEGDTLTACAEPDGYAAESGDCNDGAEDQHPGAAELCDFEDNDCDSLIDEGVRYLMYYRDRDGDGYGDRTDALYACPPPEGYTVDDGDCNDADPLVHADAAELCDGIDNNCNGGWDEGVDQRYFRDADGDGFGLEETSIRGCNPPAGYAPARGDCDDARAAVHPGAEDGAGDSLDQDCGGTAGPEPHVGFGSSSQATLQAALDLAAADTTIWVGPGTYPESFVSFKGEPVRLASTHLAPATTVDAAGQSRGFTFNSGEGSGSELDGFTVRNGALVNGGGIQVNGSSPTLRGCRLYANSATNGGGLFLRDSNAIVSDCVISNNRGVSGGGVYIRDGKPTLTRCLISRNRNLQPEEGISGGGGLMVVGSDAVLSHLEVYGNDGDYGGGIHFYSTSSATLTNSLVHGNVGVLGGGIYAISASPALSNVTVIDNTAPYGGGLCLVGGAAPPIRGSILAYNAAHNVYLFGPNPDVLPVPPISYSVVYNRVGPNINFSSLPASNLQMDPGFVSFRRNPDPGDDDLHLDAASPLVNAGDPAILDPDGSRSDIGAYGGPDADRSYYVDADKDGLFDGWEARHGLSTTTADAGQDPDGDGATNAEELAAGSDPRLQDTDGDGDSDGAELRAKVDPIDWYSQVGDPDAVARIPVDFPSVGEALAALPWEGMIEVSAGTWSERLRISGRRVTVTADDAEATVLESAGGSVITALGADLTLQSVTVTGAFGAEVGGLSLRESDGLLEGIIVRDNETFYFGGGLLLNASSPTLRDCVIEDNFARGAGGGIQLGEGSSPEIDRCRFEGNRSYHGGGLRAEPGTAPLITRSIFTANEGSQGGAMSISADAEISSCLIFDNEASLGGAIFIDNGGPSIRNSILQNNQAGSSGAIYMHNGSATLNQCTITGNQASNTAAVSVDESDAAAGRVVRLHNTVIAYNSPSNLANQDYGPAVLEVAYSALYNPEGMDNHNLETLESSNLTLEPKFLRYDGEGLPEDLHLASGSPLINAGDPSVKDGDGSRSDIGAYGGPEGDDLDLTL